MSGTAKRFNKVLHDQLRIHAAWLPITNSIDLGDYGVISGGVFVPMGNISEFSTTPEKGEGPESKLDFTSEGTRTFRFVGGAEVNVMPDEDVEAKLKIEFTRSNSFLLKAALTSSEIENVAQVARQLATSGQWNRKWSVVATAYNGADSVIMSAREAGSKVEISGKANALKKFDLGGLEAGLERSTSKQLGLEVVGKAGVVGLRLFKLKRSGEAAVLAADAGTGFESSEAWPADLEDDL